MPRQIPYDMLQDLQRGVTSFALLLKFQPVQPGFSEYGVAMHDRPIRYDDGLGVMDYSPVVAMQPSTLIFSADLSVDGGDGLGLVPEFDTPISEQDLVAGAYDFCRFRAYIVDYNNLATGRHILLEEGTTGRVTLTERGLAFSQELRGKAQALMQSITEKWSLACRATYGSQPGGPDRYPCMKDVSGDWEPGGVLGVGDDVNQTFLSSTLTPEFGGNPGKLRWTTGANAGREYEVDHFDPGIDGITISLTFPAMFPIQIGDTFEFRDDCPKTPKACKERDNWQWYRGEPNIPVGDDGQMSVPGASAGIGTGGRLVQQEQEEA